jgi:hypothetical protein
VGRVALITRKEYIKYHATNGFGMACELAYGRGVANN